MLHSRKYLTVLTLLFFVLVIVQSREKLHHMNTMPHGKTPVPVPDYNQTKLWFDQVVDHYDYTNTTLWKQRYWVVDTFFNKTVGPVFLFICGEYTCPGIPEARKWIILLAQKTQGLILVLEHRFYGESMPFGQQSLNFDKLKYLTTEQALKDLAYFIMTVQAKHLHGVDKNPWITVGGSYPGAVSAWFRYKYPHLTIGSIASSAVVKAIEDFKDFDEQIYLSASKSSSHCADSIRNLSDYVEKQVTGTDADAFKKQFKAENLSAQEFLFYWSDVTVEFIQYGQRQYLCDTLKSKNFTQQFDFVKAEALKSDPTDYGSYYLSNASFAWETKGNARSWIFQSCTEFGWLQTFSDRHPMRSKLLTIEFYRKWCQDSFGPGVLPYIDRTNNEFGAFNESADNLFMVNGV
jgi:hypothetical protein